MAIRPFECRICGSRDIEITYKGLIRDGALGIYTKKEITMWKCSQCGVIWHENMNDLKDYYESTEYRLGLEQTATPEDFFKIHDKENLDKFIYTSATEFRDKVVMDIGCGAGAFLDCISGMAKQIIAIEPAKHYRTILEKKGYVVFPYEEDALRGGKKGSVDVAVSFDVIEHVEDPGQLLLSTYELLKYGGIAIIGTPTDAPVMRELLGKEYEMKQLFSTQHLWVLNEKSLMILASEAGFRDAHCKYFQRYGIANFVGWIKEKKPRSDIKTSWMSDTLDGVWRKALEEKGLSDYIVIYLMK